MDQDFYIEESSPLKIVLTILIIIGLISGGIYYYYNYYQKSYLKLKDVTVELGMPLSDNIDDYIKSSNNNLYTLDTKNVLLDEDGNTKAVGEYSYKIEGNGQTKKGKIYVKDTTKPSVVVKELTVGVDEEFDVSEFIETCNDKSLPCTAKYVDIASNDLNKKEGTYNIKIEVFDKENNSIIKDVVLNVSSTTSLKKVRESDLEYSSISNKDAGWDNTYTVKFEKAYDEEDDKFEELVENTSSKEYVFDKEVKDKEILIVYNKYGYAIGLSIKVSFVDDTFIFVKEDAKVKEVKEEE